MKTLTLEPTERAAMSVHQAAHATPGTWVVQPTLHPVVTHLAAYSWPIVNSHYPHLKDGLWASVESYQGKRYLVDISLTLPDRSRYQMAHRRVFDTWDEAQDTTLEYIRKATRVMMRHNTRYSCTRLGHRPNHASELWQIWHAGPERSYPCGCHPGRILCSVAQEIWDRRCEEAKGLDTRRDGDVDGLRKVLREYREHYLFSGQIEQERLF